MRDYLNRLARGEFEYEIPVIQGLEKEIEKTVTEGSSDIQELSIDSTAELKGFLYSSDFHVQVREQSFCGKHVILHYSVDTTGILPGESVTGYFSLVTNGGEEEIAYRFKVKEACFSGSIGDVGNLFHFVTLVREAPEEALPLFQDERFQHIVLHDDPALCAEYQTMIRQQDQSQAMEEFLIAVQKKKQVLLHLDQTEETIFLSDLQGQEQNFTLQLLKDTWGFCAIRITSEDAFLQPETDQLTTDDFTGNHYEAAFEILPEKLHQGRNYARIQITTVYQTISFTLVVCSQREWTEKEQQTAVMRRLRCELTEQYLQFRQKKTDQETWLHQSRQLLDAAAAKVTDSLEIRLMQAQCLAMLDLKEDAGLILEEVSDQILSVQSAHPILYYYARYISSLLRRDQAYTQEVARLVQKEMDEHQAPWQLLWMAYYLDDTAEQNASIWLTRIKEAFRRGCNSPILYFEAIQIWNRQPVLLRVMNRFEWQVLLYGCRRQLISLPLACQICDLMKQEKEIPVVYMRILYALNAQYEDDRILTVLVSLLIRNACTGPAFVKLYEKAVLRGLRITRLYEYYLASVEQRPETRLPKMVLLYFAYDSQIETAQKAYIYAYVLEQKEQMQELYESYLPHMEEFALEQLRLEKIDRHLALLYRHLLENCPDRIAGRHLEKELFHMLHTYAVTCPALSSGSVIVRHKEWQGERRYAIRDGRTYVQIYTENAAVLFEDEQGIRRRNSVAYEIERLFPETMQQQEAVVQMQQSMQQDAYYPMHAFEQLEKKNRFSEEAYQQLHAVWKTSAWSDTAKKKLNSWLIQYAYEHRQEPDLPVDLCALQTAALTEQEAGHLLELLVQFAHAEEAYALAAEYGCNEASSNWIFRLAVKKAEKAGDREDPVLLAMCRYAFEDKKYDETTLAYLAAYDNGSTEELYNIWKACCNFETDSRELMERTIAQMLFIHMHAGRLTEIFTAYYNEVKNGRVVEAYLAYHAFLYFVKQHRVNEVVFHSLQERLLEEQHMPDVCKLAFLKAEAGSRQDEWTEAERNLNQQLLDEMCSRGLVFPFYRQFYPALQIPYHILDKTIVEFRSLPGREVEIAYTIQHAGKNPEEPAVMEQREQMKETICGIYTMQLTMFFGDTLQYYFIETADGKARTSESHTRVYEQINPDKTEGRFDAINDMLASMESHDMASLNKLMHGYCVQEYVGEQIFKIM